MRRTKKLLKDLLLATYWYPLRGIVNAMPASLMYRFATVLGCLFSLVARNKRRRMEAEWRLLATYATPGQALREAVRGTFVQHIQNDFEMFRYGELRPENIERYICCQGLGHLDEALSQNRGVMLSFGHFGANKMIMAAIGHHGYSMNQLSSPPTVWKEKLSDRGMDGMALRDLQLRGEADCRLPSRLINIFASLRPAYQCLRNGEVLGVAIDGPGGKRKMVLDWNGHRAVFSLGPMELALRTNAIVLPVYVVREASGRNVLIIEKLLDPSTFGEAESLTQAVVQHHAAQALQHPACYLEFMAWRRFMHSIDGSGLLVDEGEPAWQQ